VTVAACAQGKDEGSDPGSTPTTERRAGSIVIRTSVDIADAPGAEVIATGDVLSGSTLGGSPFCDGGTILDSHGSSDPEVWLIARTMTCPEGEMRLELRPAQPEELSQTGSWTVVSGTGDFEGMTGSGDTEIA
jgi:hypothetical protein